MNNPLLRIGVPAAVALLAACATPPSGAPVNTNAAQVASPARASLDRAIAALRAGDAVAARDAAQQLVLTDPRSARAHLLLAASHHLAGDPSSIELALSGYGAAERFAGQNPWVPLLAGIASSERAAHEQALEHFANAVLADPEQPLAFEGLAASAYATGRLPLAEAAATVARRMHSDSARAWQVLTLSAAGRGDAAALRALLEQAPKTVSPPELKWVSQRGRALLRTKAMDGVLLAQRGGTETVRDANSSGTAPGSGSENQSNAPANPDNTSAGANSSDSSSSGSGTVSGQSDSLNPNAQLTVDVTMIMSDARRSRAYGLNLLDGLSATYNLARNSTMTSPLNDVRTGTTTLTRAIGIPALTYTLNVFNRNGRLYEVIARPSLTALQGQQSTFFAGEQLNIALAGVNTAQLEKIDVGVTLKITPSEIRSDGAVFRVEADRSFFSDQGLGTFVQGLSTFKQSVAATADVRFGETLILSGLAETVDDSTNSRTPLLGDIPGPDLLFSRQTQTRRDRSVLVLVTPSQPVGFARTTTAQPSLDRLMTLWDRVIEPQVGSEALVRNLEKSRKFTRAAAGDVSVPSLSEPAVRNALLASIAR